MLVTQTLFNSAKASFQTHLNYVKRMDLYCNSCKITVTKSGGPSRNLQDTSRFLKLHELTVLSIKKDIELSKLNPDFAVIIAPWFAVKCYYALYYQESVLIYLLNGSKTGFTKGGHSGVRTQLRTLTTNKQIVFSVNEMGETKTLNQIQMLPAIKAGQNTRSRFWESTSCTDSLLKKLVDYKVHDAKNSGKWDLRTNKGKNEKLLFMNSKHIMLTDFFYWYRIKANYRDLDYIDFENGVTPNEVLEYVSTYYRAFTGYDAELNKNISSLI